MCFPQKSERAVFEGAVHEIVMRRNKDDDNIRVQLIQLLCQIESGFCRHIDVKEQNVDGVVFEIPKNIIAGTEFHSDLTIYTFR